MKNTELKDLAKRHGNSLRKTVASIKAILVLDPSDEFFKKELEIFERELKRREK